ncbi:MAG: vitamin B12-dependent ribonucleotide reductase [Clostridiales bacterium]|nr:vitamin B12-dependent ribonucleotide reductase [Clostridiales bacterium]
MELSANALEVLRKRYFIRDENGDPAEDAPGMFRRVAGAIAAVESRYGGEDRVSELSDAFYRMMAELRFMPNSPTLMNAGRPLGQLSACFVLPVGDSMEEIFDAVKHAALIHKSGGGTGFSFSRLRSAGESVRSTGGVASGPISFMKVFNAATDAVKQGGTRRGANMGILRVDHPDILDFIRCKEDSAQLNNFNISVAVTEEFMRAVEQDGEYELIAPQNGRVVGRLRATDVFGRIVSMAWKNGEPGIVFIDRINRDNPVPALGEVESTNPCGEQPLLPYESCNLGSINLERFVADGAVDYILLGETVDLAVRFLDDVIDANRYPLPEIDAMTRATRKVGLGVMGFAGMLYELGVPYDSDEGVALGERIMSFIEERAIAASRALASERGAFPAFGESRFADGEPVRNATVTTIAPTGTISLICGASSGIEPLFALSYVRNVMDGARLTEVNACFERVARERGFYSPALMDEIARTGSLRGASGIPEDVRRVFVTAHDVSPEYHIRMQAAFQRHTDNAVSKTVNFPADAPEESVRKVFMLAWSLSCKGVTIYRDGSRDSQVLSAGAESAQTEESHPAQEPDTLAALSPRERPRTTWGFTEKVKIGCGNLYITANFDENGLCEVFTNLGRGGGCPSQSEATSRLLSMSLRAGMSPEVLIEQLRGIRCLATMRRKNTDGGIEVLSCPDAIGRVLQKALDMRRRLGDAIPAGTAGDGALPEPSKKDTARSGGCPECGGKLEYEGGCAVCRSCGYSKCG